MKKMLRTEIVIKFFCKSENGTIYLFYSTASQIIQQNITEIDVKNE